MRPITVTWVYRFSFEMMIKRSCLVVFIKHLSNLEVKLISVIRKVEFPQLSTLLRLWIISRNQVMARASEEHATLLLPVRSEILAAP